LAILSQDFSYVTKGCQRKIHVPDISGEEGGYSETSS